MIEALALNVIELNKVPLLLPPVERRELLVADGEVLVGDVEGRGEGELLLETVAVPNLQAGVEDDEVRASLGEAALGQQLYVHLVVLLSCQVQTGVKS